MSSSNLSATGPTVTFPENLFQEKKRKKKAKGFTEEEVVRFCTAIMPREYDAVRIRALPHTGTYSNLLEKHDKTYPKHILVDYYKDDQPHTATSSHIYVDVSSTKEISLTQYEDGVCKGNVRMFKPHARKEETEANKLETVVENV